MSRKTVYFGVTQIFFDFLQYFAFRYDIAQSPEAVEYTDCMSAEG